MWCSVAAATRWQASLRKHTPCASFLNDLGVPDNALLLEGESRTTRQNAAFTAAILRARGLERIILVTSASHMPRALALFEGQGLQVTPASADHRTMAGHSQQPVLRWLPDPDALGASSRALKEIVGRQVGS